MASLPVEKKALTEAQTAFITSNTIHHPPSSISLAFKLEIKLP